MFPLDNEHSSAPCTSTTMSVAPMTTAGFGGGGVSSGFQAQYGSIEATTVTVTGLTAHSNVAKCGCVVARQGFL